MRSLTLQQTLAVSAVSGVVLILLALLGAIQLLDRERADLSERMDRLVGAVHQSLEGALWSFDDAATTDSLRGLLDVPEVQAARVLLPSGELYQQAIRPDAASEQGTLAAYLGELLFADLLTLQVDLFYGERLQGQKLVHRTGTLVVELSPAAVSRGFLGVLVHQSIGLLLAGLVLAAAIAALVHWLVTRPLSQIGNAIAEVDPEEPEWTTLTVPPRHRRNELGLLVDRTNRLFRRLGEALDELRMLANTDTLTGLPNRTAVVETTDAFIKDCRETGRQFAVMLFDIDDFKHINDTLGHEIGDQILQQIAARMRLAVGDAGVLARLGGDEFFVVLKPTPNDAAAGELAQDILAAIARRMTWGGYSMRLSSSIGVALYPDDGTAFTSLYRAADTAMYAAKSEGRGGCQFFSQDMAERALVRLRTEASLRDAIDRDEFQLYYQPKMDAHTGALMGCEALIRWFHGGQAIPPIRFIPVAESTHLIIPIGRWVFQTAGRQALRWSRGGFTGRIAVNVSPVQLESSGNFLESLVELIERGDINPEQIEIEVTESVFMKNVEERAALLQTLRDLGFTIAMDDFGTGYSSLSQLQKLPIDTLKIDKAFTAHVPDDPRIAQVILSLSQQLGLHSVAEGVECERQVDWLRRNGCAQLQGFLYAQPLSAAEFEARFVRWKQPTRTGAEA